MAKLLRSTSHSSVCSLTPRVANPLKGRLPVSADEKSSGAEFGRASGQEQNPVSHGLRSWMRSWIGKNGGGKYRNIVYIRYILLIIFYTQKQFHKHTGGTLITSPALVMLVILDFMALGWRLDLSKKREII